MRPLIQSFSITTKNGRNLDILLRHFLKTLVLVLIFHAVTQASQTPILMSPLLVRLLLNKVKKAPSLDRVRCPSFGFDKSLLG